MATQSVVPLHSNSLGKKIFKVAGVVVGSLALAWYVYPRDKYPPSVNQILRKALWEEIKTENFKESARYYRAALDECKKLQIDPLTDEYTGIEIKLAEMYEKMAMNAEAETVYIAMLNRFYEAICSEEDSSKKGKMLKRDLSIAAKVYEDPSSIEITPTRLNFLMSHINLAQDEIMSRSPDLKKLVTQPGSDHQTMDAELNANVIPNIKEYARSFEPFKEEFFVVRDAYTEMCVAAKNTKAALDSKLLTVGWMVLADMPESAVLLSQANLGSLFYLRGESLESQLHAMKGKLDSGDTSVDKDALRKLQGEHDFMMRTAAAYYDMIIQRASLKKTKFPVGHSADRDALQAVILSKHGLGVINVHNGKYVKGEEYLLEAKRMAQQYSMPEIVDVVDSELVKLNQVPH